MLIGNSQTLSTPNNDFTFTEEMFVELSGYTRRFTQMPEVGDTSTGTANYKQPGSTLPLNEFEWDLVMNDRLVLLLAEDVKKQILRYKDNNSRNFEAFELRDNRKPLLKLPKITIPITDTLTTTPVGSWVYPRFRILVTSLQWEYYCKDMSRVRMKATELPSEVIRVL